MTKIDNRDPQNKWIVWRVLLAAFFPSWKFFDVQTLDLKLEIRNPNGEWQSGVPPIPRSLKNLFFNPGGNLLHAYNNLLNHLAEDIADGLQTKTNYELVKNLCEQSAQGVPFQFRLLMGTEEILLSPVIERAS